MISNSFDKYQKENKVVLQIILCQEIQYLDNMDKFLERSKLPKLN